MNVGLAESLAVTVPRGRYKELVATSNIQSPIVAPITAGQVLGEVTINLGDELIATRELVALEDINEGSWWRQLIDTILMMILGLS